MPHTESCSMKKFQIPLMVVSAFVLLSVGAVLSYKSAEAEASHAGAALYAKIANLSLKDARERYAQLPPDQQREVWKQKLTRIDYGRLTSEQAVFISRAFTALDDLKFDGTDRPGVTKPLYT